MPQALDHSSSLRYRGLCISRRLAAASTGDSACALSAVTPGCAASWNDSHLARSDTVDQSPPSAHSSGIAGAIGSSSENDRPAYPTAHRLASSGASGSNAVDAIPSGARISSATYCGYGVSLILLTISPSSWYPRLQSLELGVRRHGSEDLADPLEVAGRHPLVARLPGHEVSAGRLADEPRLVRQQAPDRDAA